MDDDFDLDDPENPDPADMHADDRDEIAVVDPCPYCG